ncbi:PLC-like phosphodiesterase [Obelidium mucronatum]|nr:PLC-like phosphodiesterase [Obelidium mucronatum]
MCLQLDISTTKDGQIVVFHDHTIERVCGIKEKAVSDYNYTDLPRLLIPDCLKSIEATLNDDPDATRIPLLEEVLEEHPMCVIKVGNMLRKFNRTHLTVWGSFHQHQTNLCFKNFPEIPLHFCKPRVILSFVLSLFGLADWIQYRESFMAIPDYWFLMRKSWFKVLNQKGIQVVVWGSGKDGGGPGGGLNTVEKFEFVKNGGANGICTDSPTLLKSWLSTNQLTDCMD